MLQRRARHAMALAVLLLSGCSSQPLTEGVDPKGRSLVLLLDASASMADNDPGRARVQGATLAAALAGQHDNVGVIAYASKAKVLVPLRPSGTAASREALRLALDEVGTTGSTDFGAALDTAEAMFVEGQAPSGSCAIILSDGLPTGHVTRLREFARATNVSSAVPAAVARFAARGWRIFAIVFGPEAPSTRTYLTQLTGPTGGSVIEAKDASGLVDAFQAVSVQALGYISANRLASSDALQLAPGTRRLAFLGRFEGSGDLGALACDGKPADEAQVVRFPRSAPFAVALVEDPAAGRWQIESGGATAGLTLLEPGWTLELDPKAPPAVVDGGSKVPVSVRIRGDETAVARVRDSMRLELEVKRAEKVLARVPLSRAAGGELRFEGAFIAPPEEEPLTVTAIATVTEGGKSFETRRSLAISVKKGGKAAVTEAALTVGSAPTFTGFAGEELKGSISLEGDPTTALVVTVEAPRGFTANLTRIELAPKGRAQIDLTAGANATSGNLGLTVAPAVAGVAGFRRDAALTVERGFAPKTVDLGTVRAGDKAKVRVEARNVRLSTKAPLSLGDRNDLLLDTAGLPPGPFEGALEARCGATTRTIKVTANVESGAPKKLALEASWGWTKTVLDMGGEATFKLEPLQLAGMKAHIDPDLDMRIEPLGGGRYELRIFAPASLPAGRYAGVLGVTVGGADKVIPLSFEVKR